MALHWIDVVVTQIVWEFKFPWEITQLNRKSQTMRDDITLLNKFFTRWDSIINFKKSRPLHKYFPSCERSNVQWENNVNLLIRSSFAIISHSLRFLLIHDQIMSHFFLKSLKVRIFINNRRNTYRSNVGNEILIEHHNEMRSLFFLVFCVCYDCVKKLRPSSFGWKSWVKNTHEKKRAEN